MKFLKYAKWPGIMGVMVAALLLAGHGSMFRAVFSTSIAPGVTTPTSLVVTIKDVTTEEDINGQFRYTLFDQPATLDVVKKTGVSGNIFSSGGLTPVTHNGIRFLLAGTGTYSGTDPCSGNDVTDQPVYLPDTTSNQLIERLQVRHPVTGLQSGATGEIDPIHIGSDPVSLKLVFPATNSVGCTSDTPPYRSIAGADTNLVSPFGLSVDTVNNEIFASNNDTKANSIVVFNRDDNGNISPQRTLNGTATELGGPDGIFVDPSSTRDELAVANFVNDSITIYPRTWDSTVTDMAPSVVISGAATKLRGPGGIFEYKDTSGNDELYVANGPDDSITVYDRTWNKPSSYTTTSRISPAPKRIIQGPTTGLDTPCGIFVNDSEIAVVNNGDNSITFYDRLANSANGDVTPLRTIKGDKTAISNACGLTVDSANQEVAVASAGENSINFFSLASGNTGDENVYPIRQLKGTNAELGQPVAVDLDTTNSELVVANIGTSTISTYKVNAADSPDCTVTNPSLYCSAPHLLYHPVFINPKVQQQLLISYVYSGDILESTGEPTTSAPESLGYNYIFKVYDPTMHSASDVNSAYLIPPSDSPFQLADGSVAANLRFGCAVFTPFTTDELTTNCLSQPFVVSPFPPKPVLFHIAATVIGKVQNKTFVPNIAPLRKSQLPLLLPKVTLSPAGAILSIDWSYVNDAGQPLTLAPLLTTQSFTITYSKPYSEISSCYKRRTKPTLAFSSGALTRDVRTLSQINDTGCDIFLKDVSNITFSALDAYETRYSYSWNVIN